MTDLLASSKVLLKLDADGTLVPHGLGGHGRNCLTWAVAEIERLTKLHEAAAARAELAQIEIERLQAEVDEWKERWAAERRDHEATIRNFDKLMNEGT